MSMILGRSCRPDRPLKLDRADSQGRELMQANRDTLYLTDLTNTQHQQPRFDPTPATAGSKTTPSRRLNAQSPRQQQPPQFRPPRHLAVAASPNTEAQFDCTENRTTVHAICTNPNPDSADRPQRSNARSCGSQLLTGQASGPPRPILLAAARLAIAKPFFPKFP